MRTAAAVLAVAGSAVLLNSAPALAGSTGIQKCQDGQGPTETWTFVQTGGGPMNFPAGPNPPNGIFPGNALHVVIDESWTVSISNWNNEWYGVDGKAEAAPTPSGYPFPGWPKYSALFRMNNNPGGWVASGSDPDPWNPHMLRELSSTPCFAAPWAPVRMGVGMNDDNLGDNSGAWRWTLKIWRNT